MKLRRFDFDAAELDRAALESLAAAIVANDRLAWLIVDGWLKKHGYELLTPGNWRLIKKQRGELPEEGR
jgi:hypothetical protein